MAAFRDTTNLPRRAVLAGAAVAALTALPGAAIAAAGDPAFAQKRNAFRKAWEAMTDLYADIERRVHLVGNAPDVPAVLFEPLRYPDRVVKPGAEGWSAAELSVLAIKGRALTSNVIENGDEMEVRTRWRAVSAKTRKRAAKLLDVRKAYDAARKGWWDALTAVEDESKEPLGAALDLAEDIILHPVFTLGEFKDKLAIVEDTDIFNCTNRDDELRTALLQDAVTIAEGRQAHV